MSGSGDLYQAFQSAINDELSALGCHLRVACEMPDRGESILLIDADGRELGWVPESIDAPVIAAFEAILRRAGDDRSTGVVPPRVKRAVEAIEAERR